MQLAVATYSLLRYRRESGRTLEQSIDAIARLGVRGVEMSGLDDGPAPREIRRARQVRKRCERNGLQIVGYCVPCELLCDPDRQRGALRTLKNDIDIAAELGAPSIRHDVTMGFGANAAGLSIPHTFPAALKVIVPAIREAADYGQSQGIKTSLENHGFFMQHSARVERLLKSVAHPNFGLTIDMGNFLCVNEDPVKAVRRLARYAIRAHVKDFHVRLRDRMPPSGWFGTPTKIALRGAIVGHGVIDVPAQVKLLKKAGYDGWLSLEFEGMEDPLTAVELGLNYLRTLGLS